VAIKYRDVIKALRKGGWTKVQTSGSHEVWTHSDGRQVTVSGGGKDNKEVPVGTLASIRRDTGPQKLR